MVNSWEYWLCEYEKIPSPGITQITHQEFKIPSEQEARQQTAGTAAGMAADMVQVAGSSHGNKAGSWESTSLNKSTEQRKREANGKWTRLYNLKLPDLTLKPLPTVPLTGNQVFESRPISYSNHHNRTRQRSLRQGTKGQTTDAKPHNDTLSNQNVMHNRMKTLLTKWIKILAKYRFGKGLISRI